MAGLGDLKLSSQAFLRAYPWRRAEKSDAAVLGRPMSECRVALVSSAGLTAAGDPPFDPDFRGGDPSYRWLPADVDLGTLVENQRSDSFDHSGITADRNLALPLDRLRELVSAGEIGEVAPRHVSLMGSISAPGRLMRDSVPAVVEGLLEDRVEIVVLVPV